MIVKGNSNLVFLGIEKKVSKKTEQPYEIVQLADPVEYERFDFFRRDDLVVTEEIKPGNTVNCSFNISRNGYNTNIDLIAMKLVK